MSISTALTNALSGLNAASRSASLVSTNVSNAMTEGYSRREIELAAQTEGRSGSGVAVVGATRIVDPIVTGERRIADGQVGLGQTRQNFMERFADSMGAVDEAGSITGHIVSLEADLISAASDPSSQARLSSVLNSAQALAEKINSTADTLISARMTADHDIGTTVNFLQSSLQKVVDLNVAIQQNVTSGYDANSLLDQRAQIIDQISEIIPVKEISRRNSMVGLISEGGAILVDSKAAELSFSAVPTISPDMTIENGALSGLTVNGQPVSTDPDKGAIAGGKLAGLFEIRDSLVPDAQVKLDAMARDLIERFETSTVDPSLSIGDAGLFTDLNGPFDALNELGLSRRLSVNTAVDPKSGGDLIRLRDGLNSIGAGEMGDASILIAMADALRAPRIAASGGLTDANRSAVDLSAAVYSVVETNLLHAETDLSFHAAQQQSLKQLELEAGVDTDVEMQKLLLIERAYSANAKVIETIGTLFDQLMRMT